jgi:alcohol dehydrogenase class IV
MSNIGFRIFPPKRAPKKLVELFRDVPSPNISDNMSRINGVCAAIRPMHGSRQLLGSAFTVKTIRQLSEDVGTPDGLAGYGVEEERLHYLAKAGMATGNVPVNPRAPTAEDLVAIMRRCMGNAEGR